MSRKKQSVRAPAVSAPEVSVIVDAMDSVDCNLTKIKTLMAVALKAAEFFGEVDKDTRDDYLWMFEGFVIEIEASSRLLYEAAIQKNGGAA